MERRGAERVRFWGGRLGGDGGEVGAGGDGLDGDFVCAGEHEEGFGGAEDVERLEAGEEEDPEGGWLLGGCGG